MNAPIIGVHHTLVEALRETTSAKQVEGHAWLAGDDWGAAIRRARNERFADLPEPEAYRQLGQALGRSFFQTDIGALLLETIPIVPPEKVWAYTIPAMLERLRSGIEILWAPRDGGGTVRITGERFIPSEVVLGLLEAFAHQTSPPAAVRISYQDVLRLEFTVDF